MMRYESPAKRPRMLDHHEINPNDVVALLHQAVTTSQRMDILQRLLQLLKYDMVTRACHSDPRVFSFLVESGVVGALYLQLGFVLNRHGTSKEEINLTCTALDIFFRFCPALCTEQSLRDKGIQIFRCFPEALRRGGTLPVLSIWHSCSSTPFGTSLILQEPTILRLLADSCRKNVGNQECMLELLGLMKNLTYFGEDFRTNFIEQAGLLTKLMSLAGTTMSEKAEERLSAVIRNLVLSAHTRILIAQRPDVLTCIARLASRTSGQILRNILNTLLSLTIDADSCLAIVYHGEGMLVELLKRFLYFDDDCVVRKRSARALKLMARETTIPLLLHNNTLLDVLSERALQDPNSEVQAEASEAFARIAGLVKAAMAQYDTVLEKLVDLTKSPNVAPDAMSRALREQASHPENRLAIAKRKPLMTVLAKIGTSKDASHVAKENVCSAYLDLSNEERNRELIATTETLQVLALNARDRNRRNARTREVAVKTLLNLASLSSNRNNMAKQSTLIQSLLHFAADTPSDDLKQQVKTVLIQLTAAL